MGSCLRHLRPRPLSPTPTHSPFPVQSLLRCCVSLALSSSPSDLLGCRMSGKGSDSGCQQAVQEEGVPAPTGGCWHYLFPPCSLLLCFLSSFFLSDILAPGFFQFCKLIRQNCFKLVLKAQSGEGPPHLLQPLVVKHKSGVAPLPTPTPSRSVNSVSTRKGQEASAGQICSLFPWASLLQAGAQRLLSTFCSKKVQKSFSASRRVTGPG